MRSLAPTLLVLMLSADAYGQGRVCDEFDAKAWEATRTHKHLCEQRPNFDHEFIQHAAFCQTPEGNYLVLQLRQRHYLYFAVPPDVWKEFTEAPSKGRFFNFNIVPIFRCSRGE